MKKKAKLLAIVLSVAMAVSLIPVTIFALDNPTLTVSTPHPDGVDTRHLCCR